MGIRNTTKPAVTVYDVLPHTEVYNLVKAFLRKMNFSKKFIRFEEEDAIQDVMERLVCRAYDSTKSKPKTLIYMVVQSYIINLFKSRRLKEAALTVHNDYINTNSTYENIPDFYEADTGTESYFADTNMSALDRLIEQENDAESTKALSEHFAKMWASEMKGGK